MAPGDRITWTVVGTNYGPATSTGFLLADQLPPGVSFVSASASPQLTCTTPPVGSDGAVTCTAPSVAPTPAVGSSLTLTLTLVATVPAGTADRAMLTNAATVSGNEPEPAPDPHPNRATAVTTVVRPPVPPPPEPPTPPVLDTRLTLHKQAAPHVVKRGSTVTSACG